MEGRLPERPLEPLRTILCEHGMKIEKTGDLLVCSGKLSGETFEIPGNVSSQYVTGLLAALPRMSADTVLRVTGNVESAAYIAMTEQVLRMAGIRFEKVGWEYSISGGQMYDLPEHVEVEGDWSNAAFFDALTLGLLALYKMWTMDVRLTLLALIPALLMFAIGTQMSKVMTRRWEERQEAFSGLSDFAQENFSGIAVIKAFVKEYKELQAFRKLNKENEEINVTYTKIATLLEVLVTLFVESVVCIILGYGGYLVYQGRFNAGQLVEYIGYFEAIVWPIMAVSMLIEKTSRGKASLNRITELLDAPIDVADRPGVADLTDPKGGIEFRHLNFRYPDGEYDVLRDISFTIAPGESVGIVGKTGAGKTALVDLLLRTYNVPDGTLFVDGRDVNSLSIHSVRNACAYVPQDNFLFSDTIAHNIAFGVDDATPEDIERAASMADVRDNIVDFKDGYETVLGERGVTVSGGQKQRISIARALLKDAPILILDDSVSAVDTSTEKIILDNLKNSRAGKTTLLIAHRISTVERLDKIVFLNEGRVEAVGPHDQLYASCPEYRRMVDLQRLEDETKGGENA